MCPYFFVIVGFAQNVHTDQKKESKQKPTKKIKKKRERKKGAIKSNK